jgi:hypothetical protein
LPRQLGIVDQAIAGRDAFIGLLEIAGEFAPINVALSLGGRRTQENERHGRNGEKN